MINEYELRILTKFRLRDVVFQDVDDYIQTLNRILGDIPDIDLEDWK